MNATAWAHSSNASGERHPLVDHLTSVARLAGHFADSFGGAGYARLLGLWHDVGKFAPEFQTYLRLCELGRGPARGPDHKAAGALLAQRASRPALALLVQGHHGGLSSVEDCRAWLESHESSERVLQAVAAAESVLPDIGSDAKVEPPDHARVDALGAELFLRLLYSALIDADRLDTERHFDPGRSEWRGAEDVTVSTLWERFLSTRAQLVRETADEVGAVRREVYDACIEAAERPPGVFRLAVPTGGGKTLSGLAFALRHAAAHGLERVVVAVPYLSITEQTADVYRAALGEDVVLEHHSGRSEADGDDEHDLLQRLAAENWDARVIVTTTVQLFESLFAARASRCRRVHRLARSVIVLDEAQSLPVHLLDPILDALGRLARDYGSSVVLSTATQPAFDAVPAFAAVVATDIVSDAPSMYRRLRRVTYDWRLDGMLAWVDVAELMIGERHALAIVNTKADAAALLDVLDRDDVLHLSTLLCAAHRRRVIGEVKRRLAEGENCLLVSTQVVEAGVDLDFPLVLRALGPLDAIVQAAGRCNREGRLPTGRVIVFDPDGGRLPKGAYTVGTNGTRITMAQGGDVDDPAVVRAYYERLVGLLPTDPRGIQAHRRALDFRRVAEEFRMIDDDSLDVVVPYDDALARLADLRREPWRARLHLRGLRPYSVSVRAREAHRLHERGLIAPVMDGLGEWLGRYDDVRGLAREGDIDLERLVV